MGVEKETATQDTEGIEHYIQPNHCSQDRKAGRISSEKSEADESHAGPHRKVRDEHYHTAPFLFG